MALEGFVSGHRYYCDEAFPKFLALYETRDESVEDSPGFQHVATHPSPWSGRIWTFFGKDRIRQNLSAWHPPSMAGRRIPAPCCCARSARRGRWPRPTRGSRARPARRRFDEGALDPARHVYTATGTPLPKRD